MRKLLLFALPALLAAAAAGTWIAAAPRSLYPLHHSDALATGNPDHGRLIFIAADCASCHASPGQSDRLKLGGGMAQQSPFGTFYIPNISSDLQDGIGRWTAADLANALLSGVSPEEQHYYPIFPYTSFAHMRIEDVQDLMAYLQTLPAVSNQPPSHELPFPLTIRRGIGLWKMFFFRRSPILDDPHQSAAWNQGHYLVEAVGHCAECHSTRNIAGAIEASTRFAGGPDPGDVGYGPRPGRVLSS